MRKGYLLVILVVVRQHLITSGYLLTSGCSAASNWQPGPHAVSTIVCSSWNPRCC